MENPYIGMTDSFWMNTNEYSVLITNAFECFKTRLEKDSNDEKLNQSNYTIIEEIHTTITALEEIKEYYVKNATVISQIQHDPDPSFSNFDIFKTVLNFYKTDLTRGINLFQNVYQLKSFNNSLIKKEIQLIDDVLSKFN